MVNAPMEVRHYPICLRSKPLFERTLCLQGGKHASMPLPEHSQHAINIHNTGQNGHKTKTSMGVEWQARKSHIVKNVQRQDFHALSWLASERSY